jgi:hypothetical protein
LAIVAREQGFLAAWSSGSEIYTISLDSAGNPLRPPSGEVDEEVDTRGVAMDWRDGAGGIAYWTIAATAGDFGRYDTRLKFFPIDGDGHILSAPRTYVTSDRWYGTSAVAVRSPDRISILVDACNTFTMRLDVDPRGELVAVDKRFLRDALNLGAAVVRRADKVWAASLSWDWIDLRPLCEPPATTLVSSPPSQHPSAPSPPTDPVQPSAPF